MDTNVGTLDQWARIIIGLGLISLVFVGPLTPWGWLGAIPLLTGLGRYCPVYGIFGWSTCKAGGPPKGTGTGTAKPA